MKKKSMLIKITLENKKIIYYKWKPPEDYKIKLSTASKTNMKNRKD